MATSSFNVSFSALSSVPLLFVLILFGIVTLSGNDACVVLAEQVSEEDWSKVAELAGSHDLLVTVEENTIQGGAGSAVAAVSTSSTS